MKLKNKPSEGSLPEKATVSRKYKLVTSTARRERQLYDHTAKRSKDFRGTGQRYENHRAIYSKPYKYT